MNRFWLWLATNLPDVYIAVMLWSLRIKEEPND